MKANETVFLKCLESKNQFIIPIYQRPYSWTLKQCEQLWDDILRVASDTNASTHFVGSLVCIEQGLSTITSVPQRLVIDGQQRLTTITLLLGALCQSLDGKGPEDKAAAQRIRDYYLFNSLEPGDQRFKLLLTQQDKETLIRLLQGQEPPTDASVRLTANFEFFSGLLAAGADANLVFTGIKKLVVVDVALDRRYDNAQMIFESLNSTGLDLSQADLIRNFVLMGLEPAKQTDFYNRFWQPMEQGFNKVDEEGLFDRFMKDYLTLKLKRTKITKIQEVYAKFKEYTRSNPSSDIEVLLADISRHAKHYVNLLQATDQNAAVSQALQDLNDLKITVVYPFLLEIYDDYYSKRIGAPELLQVLRAVESYVFRRAICGIPTNSLDKTFSTLSRELNKEAYVESLGAAFQRKESYLRFPSNEEFATELQVKDVYNLRIRNYILRRLENHDRKERVAVEAYTIEHIMPQNENLSEAWRRDLGPAWKEIQGQYLHTIGNLTLTGYNPELSDRPFAEKRDMKGGFRDSPIRLNRELAPLERWNGDTIVQRAKRIASTAIGIWSAPSLSAETLAKYQPISIDDPESVAYTLDDHPHLRGAVLDLYQHLKQRVINLDSSVREVVNKNYIAFRSDMKFLEVRAKKSVLTLWVKGIDTEEVEAPGGFEDWKGAPWVEIATIEQLEAAFPIVKQAFANVREAAG